MSSLVSTVMIVTLVVGPFHLSRALVGFALSAGLLVAASTGVPACHLWPFWRTTHDHRRIVGIAADPSVQLFGSKIILLVEKNVFDIPWLAL
jgi:hypothetical protein